MTLHKPKVTIYPPGKPAPEGLVVFPIIETSAQLDAYNARLEAMARAEAARDVTPKDDG
jgi:hypothetical protein